jgi:hypothetical protein
MPISAILWIVAVALEGAVLLRQHSSKSPFSNYIYSQLVREGVLACAVLGSSTIYFLSYWVTALVTIGFSFCTIWAALLPMIESRCLSPIQRATILRYIRLLFVLSGVVASIAVEEGAIVMRVLRSLAIASSLIGITFIVVIAYLFLWYGVLPSRSAVALAAGYSVYCSTKLISTLFDLPGWALQASWIIALLTWLSAPPNVLAGRNTQENVVANGN